MSTLTLRQSRENEKFPFDSYLYDERVGITCVAIPKCGCATLKRWYIAMTNPQVLKTPKLDVHKYAVMNLALIRRNRDETASILAQHRTIAIVRDPVERLRAAFIDKFVRPMPSDLIPAAREVLEDIHRARGVAVTHDHVHATTFGSNNVFVPASSSVNYEYGITFREFVEYVCLADETHLDAHWRPQTSFLRGQRIDAVIPLSHLTATLDDISTRLGSPYHAAVENTTRKEPTEKCLADTPSGLLRSSNLRPPLNELMNDAVRDLVYHNLLDDVLLHRRSLQMTPDQMSDWAPSRG